MRTLSYLSAIIATMTTTTADAQDPGTGPEPPFESIVVIGNPIPQIPVQLGRDFIRGTNWLWNDTPQGSGGGSVSPGDFSSGSSSEICVLFSLTGLPEGCNRTYLAEGLSSINEISNPWQLEVIFNHASNGHLISYFHHTSLLGLRSCYSNMTRDPSSCEENYSNYVETLCNTWVSTSQTAHYSMPDRELCLVGAANIESRMSTVYSNRNPSEWFQTFEDTFLGVISRFQVAYDFLHSFLPADQYNQLFIASRLYSSCAFAIGEWDDNNCGYEIPL